MHSEKIAAGMQSAAALGKHGATSIDHSACTFALMLEASAAMMALGASPNGGQFLARQARLTHAVSRLARSALDLSNSTARLAADALAPIHLRAVANVKRLAQR